MFENAFRKGVRVGTISSPMISQPDLSPLKRSKVLMTSFYKGVLAWSLVAVTFDPYFFVGGM